MYISYISYCWINANQQGVVTLSNNCVQHCKSFVANVRVLSLTGSLLPRALSEASFETLDQVSWRPEIRGNHAVHCRTDQEKAPLRPSLQEEGRHRSNQESWPQAPARISRPSLEVRRILRNLPVSKSTPLRCYFSVSSQSGKRSFQISLISFHSLGPPRHVLCYTNLTCTEFLAFSIHTPIYQFTLTPP